MVSGTGCRRRLERKAEADTAIAERIRGVAHALQADVAREVVAAELLTKGGQRDPHEAQVDLADGAQCSGDLGEDFVPHAGVTRCVGG